MGKEGSETKKGGETKKARDKVARDSVGFHRAKQISMPPWALFTALVERLSPLFNLPLPPPPPLFSRPCAPRQLEYLRVKVRRSRLLFEPAFLIFFSALIRLFRRNLSMK